MHTVCVSSLVYAHAARCGSARGVRLARRKSKWDPRAPRSEAQACRGAFGETCIPRGRCHRVAWHASCEERA
jgi:hypothetical protein